MSRVTVLPCYVVVVILATVSLSSGRPQSQTVPPNNTTPQIPGVSVPPNIPIPGVTIPPNIPLPGVTIPPNIPIPRIPGIQIPGFDVVGQMVTPIMRALNPSG